MATSAMDTLRKEIVARVDGLEREQVERGAQLAVWRAALGLLDKVTGRDQPASQPSVAVWPWDVTREAGARLVAASSRKPRRRTR